MKTCEFRKIPAAQLFIRFPITWQLVMLMKDFGIVTMHAYFDFKCFGREFNESVQSRKITPPLSIIKMQSISLSISNSRINLLPTSVEYLGS
jgi:competence CoiA-like predicted nuclease